MAESRPWIWVAGSLGTGAVGAGLWWARRDRRGHLYKVKDRYYADLALVDDLARRMPGAKRWGAEIGAARPAHQPGPPSYSVEFFLYQRGRVSFERVDGFRLPKGTTLPGQLGGALYVLEAGVSTPPGVLEEFVVQLVHFGIARSGGAFSTWPSEAKGRVYPAPGPLHPTAFDARAGSSWSSPPVTLPARKRPDGHYFKVGQQFYADDEFLKSLEWFQGADHVNNMTVVPTWKRGSIQLARQTDVHTFPEQEGALHLITPMLDQVTLEDFLIELEHYGLVSWGGEWPTTATNPTERWVNPTKGLPLTPEGHAFMVAGELYLDQAVVDSLLTRLPRLPGARGVLWRGSSLEVKPQGKEQRFREQRGNLYVVAGDAGAVRALIAAIVLHRLAYELLSFDRFPWRDPEGRWFR